MDWIDVHHIHSSKDPSYEVTNILALIQKMGTWIQQLCMVGGVKQNCHPSPVSLFQERKLRKLVSPGTFQKCSGGRNGNKSEWLQSCKVQRILSPNVPPSGQGTLLPTTSFPMCVGVWCMAVVKEKTPLLAAPQLSTSSLLLAWQKRHHFVLETQQFQCHSSKAGNGTEFPCCSRRTISRRKQCWEIGFYCLKDGSKNDWKPERFKNKHLSGMCKAKKIFLRNDNSQSTKFAMFNLWIQLEKK